MASYIRLLHASPDAPAVDVYADGKLIARNLTYRNFTEYVEISPGKYNITVYPAGTQASPVINTSHDVPDRSILTVAAIGRLADIQLRAVPDTPMSIPPGETYLRFAHFSPNAPNVDITLPDGTVLFSDVAYTEVTDYKSINPGTYTLQARVAGTDNVVLTVPNQRLLPDKFYTAYAVGLVGESPPLQLLTPLDGNSYIKV